MGNNDLDEKKWKKLLDNILIINLFILILGAFFFLASVLSSINGSQRLYNLFQHLWYPVFIPALSLFFTAILIEVIISKLPTRNKS